MVRGVPLKHYSFLIYFVDEVSHRLATEGHSAVRESTDTAILLAKLVKSNSGGKKSPCAPYSLLFCVIITLSLTSCNKTLSMSTPLSQTALLKNACTSVNVLHSIGVISVRGNIFPSLFFPQRKISSLRTMTAVILKIPSVISISRDQPLQQ